MQSSSDRVSDHDQSSSEMIESLVTTLSQKGQPKKKAWWERYLKNEIQFFGVPMDDIRTTIKDEWKQDTWTDAQLFSAALELMREPMAECKLAGILVMQLYLVDDYLDADRDLPFVAQLFADGFIFDWNTTDWLCVRVLGKLIERHNSVEGTNNPVTAVLKTWMTNPDHSLWQRRASLVSFVNVTEHHKDLILEMAHELASDTERFAQTAIGWTLRSLSVYHPKEVFMFVQEHESSLSKEAIRMAAAKLSDSQRKKLGVSGKRKRR